MRFWYCRSRETKFVSSEMAAPSAPAMIYGRPTSCSAACVAMVSKTHEQSGNATFPPVFVVEIGSCFWAFKAADDKEICVAVALRSLTL